MSKPKIAPGSERTLRTKRERRGTPHFIACMKCQRSEKVTLYAVEVLGTVYPEYYCRLCLEVLGQEKPPKYGGPR